MPRDEVLLADILRYARQAARAAAGLTGADPMPYSGTDMVAVIEVAQVHVPNLIRRLESLNVQE